MTKNKTRFHFFSFGAPSVVTDRQVAVVVGVAGVAVAAAGAAVLSLVGVPLWAAPLAVAAWAHGRLAR